MAVVWPKAAASQSVQWYLYLKRLLHFVHHSDDGFAAIGFCGLMKRYNRSPALFLVGAIKY